MHFVYFFVFIVLTSKLCRVIGLEQSNTWSQGGLCGECTFFERVSLVDAGFSPAFARWQPLSCSFAGICTATVDLFQSFGALSSDIFACVLDGFDPNLDAIKSASLSGLCVCHNPSTPVFACAFLQFNFDKPNHSICWELFSRWFTAPWPHVFNLVGNLVWRKQLPMVNFPLTSLAKSRGPTGRALDNLRDSNNV